MNAPTNPTTLPSPTLPSARNNAIAERQSPATPTVVRSNLTSAQKAALVIAALGPESAGPIVERIDDKHLRSFARAYAQFQTIPKETLKAVIEEFVLRLSREDDDIQGGFEQTRELLSQFISSDNITRLMEDINVPGGESVWDRLARTPDKLLAKYLEDQNIQLIAIVLSKMNTEQASRIINLLNDDTAQAVIVRLASPLNVSREAMKIVTETIARDFLAPMRNAAKRRNPGEMIGSMMNNVASEKREKLLSFIEESVPTIMRDVRKSMLTFQDITARVPTTAIPLIVKEAEINEFLIAAKFGKQNAPSCVDYIFKNISQRMAKQYEEQMDALKPVPVKEAEAAQAAFMGVVRRLVAAGEFELLEIKSEDEAEDEVAI